MRPKYYKLNEKGDPVPATVTEWAIWFEQAKDERIVAKEIVHEVVPKGGQHVLISTVFLGMDHNFLDEGEPLIYETMVFGGSLNGEQERYSTKKEALKGHAKMVERIKKGGTHA